MNSRAIDILALLLGAAIAYVVFEPVMAARAAVPIIGDMSIGQLAVLVDGWNNVTQ